MKLLVELYLCSWALQALGAYGAEPLGATLDPSEIGSPHVYQNVGMLRNELEQIRLVLGERPPRTRDFKLADVAPRQVFFQAQTLFRKSNHLAREVAGISRVAPRAAPERAIAPGDVYQMVDAARDQLAITRSALGITETVEVPAYERRRQSADVMRSIILTMDVLNSLVSERVEWPTIYNRVLQMVTYVGGALSEDNRYPPLPPHACCKMPQEVLVALLDAFEQVRPVADQAGMPLMKVQSITEEEGGASRATVYDMTTVLVADLAELTLRLGTEDVAPPDYERPTRILPSHAFQLVGVLRFQLQQLAAGAVEAR